MCCAKLDDSSQTTHVKSEVTTFSVVLLKINKKKNLNRIQKQDCCLQETQKKAAVKREKSVEVLAKSFSDCSSSATLPLGSLAHF